MMAFLSILNLVGREFKTDFDYSDIDAVNIEWCK